MSKNVGIFMMSCFSLLVILCVMEPRDCQHVVSRNFMKKVGFRTKTHGDCPPVVGSWIPGCGQIKPPGNLTSDWVRKFIDFEIRERKYLVIVKETLFGIDEHSFPGVLIENSVIIAICAHFHPFASPDERDIVVTRPSSRESREYSKTSFTLVQPCHFRSDTVANNPVVLEFGMARTLPPSIITDLSELAEDELCRYYSFPVQNEDDASDKVEGYVALEFLPYDPVCANRSERTKSICGLIFDPSMQFCSLIAGGVVFCHGSLLGIARTGCVSHTGHFYANKTSFPMWVLTISPSEKKYWKSLRLHRDRSYKKRGNKSPSLRLNGPNDVSIIISLVICIVMPEYMREHRL